MCQGCGRLLYEAAHEFFLHMTVCGDAHKQLVGKLEPDHDPLVGEFLQLQNHEACDQTFRLKDASRYGEHSCSCHRRAPDSRSAPSK